MSITGRLRLIFGIIFVILLVIGLTTYLNYTMSLAQSIKGEIASNGISVGSDYAGLVVQQKVQVGEKVKKGQTMFEIQSTQLNQDLTSGHVSAKSLSFKVDPTTNYAVLVAPNDGIVRTIYYQSGAYVPTGSVLATVDTAQSLYVEATFHLSPPDFARIDKNSQLDLKFPDNSTRRATIYSVTLTPDKTGAVDTVVKARIQGIDLNNFQFAVGTPINATLHLKQAHWYQALTNYIKELFQPTGR